MSALDQALKAATEDPARAGEFYRLFLGLGLKVPVKAADEASDQMKRVNREQRFFPLYVQHEDCRYVPAFDSVERLDTWRESVSLDYIELTGAELLMVLEPSIRVAINLGTDSAHMFLGEEMSELRRLFDEEDEDELEEEEKSHSVPIDQVSVTPVLDPSPDLEKFLETELQHHAEVVQAFVANISSKTHKKKKLTLMLTLDGANSARALEVQKAVSLAARKILGEHAQFYLMVDDGGQIATAIRRNKAIYARDKVWH